MRAPLPERARRFLVALEARGVALGDRRPGFLAEVDQRAALLAARFRVLLAGTVTALAAELLLFVARMLEEQPALGSRDELGDLLFMAIEARCRAGVSGRSRRFCRLLGERGAR
jgi:hypothetical protein